jgi:hypothetical protein
MPFERRHDRQEAIMGEIHLTMTAEEREYLAELLETVLKTTRVEQHRTRTPAYRKYVLERESVIEGLMNKLNTAAVSV